MPVINMESDMKATRTQDSPTKLIKYTITGNVGIVNAFVK